MALLPGHKTNYNTLANAFDIGDAALMECQLPRETTFDEIEAFGHQAGRVLARAVDPHLAAQHRAHFASEQSCPTCDDKCPALESPHALLLQTLDGDVKLHEPVILAAGD